MPQATENSVSKQLLIFRTQQEIVEDWNPKVKKIVKTIKTSELDDFDLEFIDLDQLFSLYLNEFRTARQSTFKRLQKTFIETTQKLPIGKAIESKLLESIIEKSLTPWENPPAFLDRAG